jgi:hypothetical protein
MNCRRVGAVLIIAALLVASAATSAGAAAAYTVAAWEMNESPGSRIMRDTSGHGLNGVIGSEVLAGTSISGATGYRFSRLAPDTPPAHPQHLAVVADDDSLNPHTGEFAITMRLRTTYQFGNIVQKGQATVSGGNFKMQIPSGIVQCVFRGSGGSLTVIAPRKINDGNWHVVRCERGYAGVLLSIDGSQVAARRGWTGRIENSWPLSVGGKTGCNQISVGCDYFAGDIDYLRISTD